MSFLFSYVVWLIKLAGPFVSHLLVSFPSFLGLQDSLLLGNVHLALLKLLLSDIDKELSRGFFSHASKNCKYLGLLNSVSMSKKCMV